MTFKDGIKFGFGLFVGLRLATVVDKLLGAAIKGVTNDNKTTDTEAKINAEEA